VKQKLADRYSSDSLAVILVWAPMMASDSEDAARESARMFGPAVVQFYDPERAVGHTFRREVFPDAYEKGYASLPPDHWLRESMSQMKSRYDNSPEWDIYLFFGPGLVWKDAPPFPTRFVRHLGRIVENDDGMLSLMWINDYSNPPVEGQLFDEVERLGSQLLGNKARR